ncbi:MAG: iron-containing alcohol dehydrogenase, partial [Anaerolineaceae bacterium]
MQFEFTTAGQILFGAGMLRRVPELTREFGDRVFLVTGKRRTQADQLIDLLVSAGLAVEHFGIAHEPTLADLQAGVRQARSSSCQLIIGMGGGSAMDAAKAISALTPNPGNPMDYLEVVGTGKTLTETPLPVIAIPTTAGTGSEVMRNATVVVSEKLVKVSLRHRLMLPRAAVIDPELTMSMTPELTASTGMDALTQVIEPYVSKTANALTDGFCRDGISRGAWALPRAYDHGNDLEARVNMSLVSLYGGLALANSGLGAVHGLAAPLGGMYPIPHGTACAALLAPVMRANIHALRTRDPENLALKRYHEVA